MISKKDKAALKRYRQALERIASASSIKHEMRDYANIGKNAIFTAKEALSEPCTKCGRPTPSKRA